jgi:hypothetical protein
MGEDAPMTARWPPAAAARLPPFTAAQYEELEQQALIYKYLVAGVPVPPDLVLPIRRGLDSLAARFYNHPARTSCSYFLPLLYHRCIAFGCLFSVGFFVYSDQAYFASIC